MFGWADRRSRVLFALSAVAFLTACSANNSGASIAPTQSSSVNPTATTSAGIPVGFSRLSDVDPTIVQEIRYATDFNFVGKRIIGYDAPECWLTVQAAQGLQRAQTQARARGYSLKVYDCYRPQRSVDEFVVWAKDLSATQMKAEFYPRVSKDRLFADGYIAAKSGHSRGSTFDVTLVPLPGSPSPPWSAKDGLRDCAAPVGARTPDSSINMGTSFDCFDVLSHTENPATAKRAKVNREMLVGLMAAQDFRNLPEEWWHYTLNGEPFPDTYFNVPIAAAGR